MGVEDPLADTGTRVVEELQLALLAEHDVLGHHHQQRAPEVLVDRRHQARAHVDPVAFQRIDSHLQLRPRARVCVYESV